MNKSTKSAIYSFLEAADTKLEGWLGELSDEIDELEGKQGEKESDARQEKIGLLEDVRDSLQGVVTGIAAQGAVGDEFRSDVERVEIYRGGPLCLLHVLVWDGPHGTTRAVYNGRRWVFQSGCGPWGAAQGAAALRLIAHFHLDLSASARPL